MLIPIRDDNPTRRLPVLTVSILALNVIAFLYAKLLGPTGFDVFTASWGAIPFEVTHGVDAISPTPFPVYSTLVTSLFMHGGWLHIAGNMLYLWIFGNNVEDAMGHVRFPIFYVLCGVAAALAQGFHDPNSAVPMIGASGAIGGVLGGYLLLYPRARVLVLIPLGFFTQLIRIPALAVLGFWFVLQFIQSALSSGEGGGVAYWAHIGGFVAGMVLILVFRDKGIPLLGRPRRRGPWG
ncbi:MAG: rhomboid family intramembrane serine protease [Alphaproteobacteria bacterium]|nr:rhomboid family intramembrane serine protease [Alphaproteobacteria bacterium]